MNKWQAASFIAKKIPDAEIVIRHNYVSALVRVGGDKYRWDSMLGGDLFSGPYGQEEGWHWSIPGCSVEAFVKIILEKRGLV